jgi:hypothetical protein
MGADVTPVPTTEAVQAASPMQERRNGSRATPRRRGRLDMWVRISGAGELTGGIATNATPRFDACRRRGQVVVCTVLPTFLSKVRACTVGSATGLAARGRFTVAGLCRDLTGLRDHAAFDGCLGERSTGSGHR